MSDISYPGNSHKKKEEAAKAVKPETLEKVISGKVIERKKPLGKRIAETFTGDDTSTVFSVVVLEVVVPAVKQLIADSVREGVERLLFGDGGRGTRGGGGGGRAVRTNYSAVSSNAARANSPRAISQRARAGHDFTEIVLESRGEAEKVRDDLMACIEQYDVATVSDLYDLVGVTGSFTDDKWGWYDLRSTTIRRVREGYLLDLPKTEPID